MRIALGNPYCGPHVLEATQAFFENRSLVRCFASLVDFPTSPPFELLKKLLGLAFPKLQVAFSRRKFEGIPRELFRLYPWKEILRFLGRRMRLSPALIDQMWEWGDLSFDQWMSKQLTSDMDAIYVYEHTSLETIKSAKSLGLVSFREQSSQHHKFFSKVLQRELERFPDLLNVYVRTYLSPKSKRRNYRRDQELEMTHYIVCNSSFTKRTLLSANIPDSKILLVPLGFPEIKEASQETRESRKPLVFLYAGTKSLRKGTHLLCQAWEKLKLKPSQAELWLVGGSELPRNFYSSVSNGIRWIPSVGPQALRELYQKASVFVFPSLADGFGMVISEAMSVGLPVITTECTMGPDFIRHGKNGWIVPAGDSDVLADQMNWCVQNRNRIPGFQEEALKIAKSRPWKCYREELVRVLTQKVQEIRENQGPIH